MNEIIKELEERKLLDSNGFKISGIPVIWNKLDELIKELKTLKSQVSWLELRMESIQTEEQLKKFEKRKDEIKKRY